nr:uncharacterized protein LOC109150807 [Ipomoea batatas]GMD36195.1 uncharacterized protein LOC109150807 [Ipomoea batatas]
MLEETSGLPFLNWLDADIKGFKKDHRQHSSSVTFAVSTWWLWRWRNDRIFNQKTASVRFKNYWIQTKVAEVNTAFERSKGPLANPTGRSWRIFRWAKPPPGWVKINVDGSCNPQTGKASCGGIARNEDGDWIMGLSHTIGNCLIDVAEAWALMKGIQLAKEIRCCRVCLESDSKTIVNAFNTSATNQVADVLARLAPTNLGTQIFSKPPGELAAILDDDKFGFPVWRQTDTVV